MAVLRTLPPPDSGHLWRASLLAAAGLLVAHACLTVALRNDAATLQSAGNLLSFVETTAATLALGLVAWRMMTERRRGQFGWGFLTLALFVTALGDATWWLIQNAQGEVPFPSLADPLYLAFYPLFALGLVLLPAMPHAAGQRTRLALDMASALFVGILLFWVFGVGPLVKREYVSGLELATAIAYPAGDLALLAALLLLLNRRISPSSQPMLRLLMVGTVIMLVTDSLFSYQMVQDTYISGGFLDLGFTLTYALFGLAAMRALTATPPVGQLAALDARDDQVGVPVANWSLALPYGAMLLAFLLLIWDHFYPTGVDFPVLVAVLGSIVVLIAARQVLALLERNALQRAQRDLNRRLLAARDELEARVEERTIELTQANAALAAEVAQHQLAEAQLRLSLKEKEVLLKEVHHRVRNNLQVVSSLFSLQSHTAGERTVAEVLSEGQARIKAMSLIHEKLYASPHLSRIDFRDYLRSLAEHLFRAYQVRPGYVTLEVDLAEAWVGMDTAVPCGLIVNELLSNALKHAFPGDQGGTVCIQLSRVDADRLKLTVSDDGVGLPPGFDFHHAGSLGLQLSMILAKQIDGEVDVYRTRGTRYEITFPVID